MKTSRKVAVIALLLFCFLGAVFITFTPNKTYSACSGTVSYSGISLAPGETKNITIKLTNASNVQAVGGYYNVQDETCATVVSATPAKGVRYNNSNHMFALVDTDAIASGTPILTVSIKGLKECSTKLVFSDVVLTSADDVPVKTVSGVSSGAINVKKPVETTQPTTKAPTPNNNNNSNNNKPNNTNNNNNNKKETTTTKPTTTRVGSNNNYLSSLSISGKEFAFDKNQEEYSIEVEEDVESISINAAVEDSKATFKVLDNESLVKGKNTIKVVVEAENGSTRTYYIYVTRKGEEEVKGEEETPPTPSTYLSSITLTNGKLLNSKGKEIKNYDKTVTTYYYTKGDNFSYDFVKEYDDASVNVYETNNTITIIVSLSEDDYRVYTLVRYDGCKCNVLYIVLLFIIGIIIGFILKCLIKRNK